MSRPRDCPGRSAPAHYHHGLILGEESLPEEQTQPLPACCHHFRFPGCHSRTGRLRCRRWACSSTGAVVGRAAGPQMCAPALRPSGLAGLCEGGGLQIPFSPWRVNLNKDGQAEATEQDGGAVGLFQQGRVPSRLRRSPQPQLSLAPRAWVTWVPPALHCVPLWGVASPAAFFPSGRLQGQGQGQRSWSSPPRPHSQEGHRQAQGRAEVPLV